MKPDFWNPSSVDEEQSWWSEWSFLFKSYLGFIKKAYQMELAFVEQDVEKEIDMSTYSDEEKAHPRAIFSYLASYLKGKQLRIVRSVTDGDGVKAWQLLRREFQPQTRQRELGLMQAVVGFPPCEKGKVVEGRMKYEKLITEYEKLSGTDMDDNLKVATVMRCCQGQFRQRQQLNVKPGTRYPWTVRQSIVAYEHATANWTASKILNHDDIVPMDVDRVQGYTQDEGQT